MRGRPTGSALLVVARRRLTLTLALTMVCCLAQSRASLADDICEATALRDVPAIDAPNSFIRKGGIDDSITQFRVNKQTGETSYCSHGGYCYPTHVRVGDDLLLALKMSNCKPSLKPYPDVDSDFIIYDVDVIRSQIPAAAMRREDVKNRLLTLGLCEACADNVAQYYTTAPRSECAALARSALEGNPDAAQSLQEMPPYCHWHYPDQK